jgi:YHS domain-containing protein
MHRARHALLLAALVLGGCNALLAQNPSSPMRPVNAVRDGDESRLILQGYDVVAYSTQGQAVPGLAQYRSQYEGVTYHFSSAAHQSAFQLDPAKFQPAYHGFDAMRMVFAVPEAGDPRVWEIIGGRLFIFADPPAKAAFALDPAGNAVRADAYWNAEVQGTITWWQRSKRLVDRVPGYKSRDELAREVAEARAKAG